MKLIKHFLLYISICISSLQIVPIFSNHELLQENAVIKLTDEQKLNTILRLLKGKVALHNDDIKEWDNPDQIEERALKEIKIEVWNLYANNLITKDSAIDFNKIAFEAGYKLNKKEDKLVVNLKYGNSKGKEFVLNIWKVSTKEVVSEINKKIRLLMHKKMYFENEWDSITFINSLGKKYEDEINKKLSNKIKVNNDEVKISSHRIKFYQLDLRKKDLENKIIFLFDYVNSSEYIQLNVDLKHKILPNDLLKKILPYLQKFNLLKLNFNYVLEWKNLKKYIDIFENHKNSILEKINPILTTLGILDNNLSFDIEKLSPVGPWDSEITFYLRINKSSLTIPIKMYFKKNINDDMLIILEKLLNQKFSGFFIKEDLINNSKLEQMLKQKIGHKLFYDNKEVDFNPEKLKLVSKIKKQNYLQVIFTFDDYPKELKVNLNII